MKKLSLFVCTLLLMASTVFAADVMQGKKMTDEIPNDPTVLTGQFANGLTYYIKENAEPENRADLQMLIGAGSLDEEDSQWGLAHFIEHMCFNGTKNFPKNELVSYFESIGMEFGGDLNAYTTYDRTVYTIQVPTDNPKIVENGVQILEDWLHNVSFDNEELEKERGVIIEEWRVRSGVMGRYSQEMFHTYAPNTAWANRFTIGDTNVIRTAPRERFTTFYKDFYRPNHSAVIAVGDFDKNEMYKLIESKFAHIKNPKPSKKVTPRDIPLTEGIRTKVFQDKEWSNQNILSVMMLDDDKTISKTYEGYRKGIIESLASIMLSMRFAEYSQEEDCPIIGASGTISGFISNLDAFSMQAAAKEGKSKEAFDFIISEAYRAKQHGFTKGELKRSKEQMMAMIDKYYNERDKTPSANFAAEYMTHFQDGSCFPGIEVEKKLYDKWIPEITLEEVNKVFSDAVNTKSVILASADNTENASISATESDLKNIFDKASKRNYEPYQDNSIDEPLMAKIPTPGKVVKEEKIKEIDAVKWTLSNGAEVYLKNTNFKNDEINMRSFAMGGTSMAATNNLNNANHSASIVNSCGIGKFDDVQLSKLLTGKRVGVYPSIGTYNIGISGNSTKKDLETFFQLVNMYFTAPRVDEKPFNLYKENAIESWDANQADPQKVLYEEFAKTRFNNNPRRMPQTREDLESLDMNKAFEFYKSQFDGVGQFKFVFVGSLDMDVMKKYVETYIASLPKGKTKNWKDNKVRGVKGKVDRTVYAGVDPKANLIQFRSGEIDFTYENIMETTALGKLLSIRLREVIREEEGGTYGVQAYVSPSRLPEPTYNFVVSFNMDPERLDHLLDRTQETINTVIAGDFDEKNVLKIKKQMKRKRETDLKKNRFWLQSIYNRLYNDQPFSIINDYNKYVDQINKDYLTEAAKKYCGNENFIQVIQLPENMKK